MLQDKGYTETRISSHLSKHVPPKRYNTSFALLSAMAVRKNLTIDSPTDAFVGLLIDLHQFSESHARNAYSALLLILGFDQIEFHPMLAPYRKQWNKSTAKYAAFWDPMPIFLAFINTSYDRGVISQVRLKLILLWRFLTFFRSIHFSQVRRDVSSIGDRNWVVVRRKNQWDFRWEEVPSLQDHAWSPWHILCLCVSLTSKQVAPGGPLLITLHRSFAALTSNAIEGLTRRELQRSSVRTQ